MLWVTFMILDTVREFVSPSCKRNQNSMSKGRNCSLFQPAMQKMKFVYSIMGLDRTYLSTELLPVSSMINSWLLLNSVCKPKLYLYWVSQSPHSSTGSGYGRVGIQSLHDSFITVWRIQFLRCHISLSYIFQFR